MENPQAPNSFSHIVLTSHPQKVFKDTPKINWGAPSATERGPIVGGLRNLKYKNVIGAHSGSYSIYHALSKAQGSLPRAHKPRLDLTFPPVQIGPFDSWFDPKKIVSLDPWGGQILSAFKGEREKGYDIRPTIAITQAHLHMPELYNLIQQGELKVDGKIVKNPQNVAVTKLAVEPVWYLPGIAERLGVSTAHLRKSLYHDTGGMFPELITRPDLQVLLPPIGNSTVYLFGDPSVLNPKSHSGKLTPPITARVHDECNGSDVFGSDICTCRPYLVHGIFEAIKMAQQGGLGLIVYFRKEGRALGEVTKFLVYNKRKRQAGGDTPDKYFECTAGVAGVEDMRFQNLMPDVLQWLGVHHIERLVSMSDMKYNAITGSGISIGERVSIPDHLIPEDAWVEIEAKKSAGYYTEKDQEASQSNVKGRKLHE